MKEPFNTRKRPKISFSILVIWNYIFGYGNKYQRLLLCNSILKESWKNLTTKKYIFGSPRMDEDEDEDEDEDNNKDNNMRKI